jgi:hypothetical protein
LWLLVLVIKRRGGKGAYRVSRLDASEKLRSYDNGRGILSVEIGVGCSCEAFRRVVESGQTNGEASILCT